MGIVGEFRVSDFSALEQVTDDKFTVSDKSIIVVETDDVELLHDLWSCQIADWQTVSDFGKGLQSLCFVENHFASGGQKAGGCIVKVRTSGMEAKAIVFERRAFEKLVAVF